MNTKSQIELGRMVAAYLECAAWSSGEDGEFDGVPFGKKAYDRALADCNAFLDKAGDLLENLDAEQVGHDLWLTRVGHGAGFWDRGLGALGERLTDLAHVLGHCDVYMTKRGKLEFT